MSHDEHVIEPQTSSEFLRLALAVVLYEAQQAKALSGRPNIVFPCEMDGKSMRVTVSTPAEETERRLGLKVQEPKHYVGWYGCGCKIDPVPDTFPDQHVIEYACPQHGSPLVTVALKTGRGYKCDKHGIVKGAYRYDGKKLEKEVGCPVCHMEDRRQQQSSIVCPLGKSPCKLADPNCNVSPGLFVVERQGQRVRMCGDCVSESGSEVIATARSIDG